MNRPKIPITLVLFVLFTFFTLLEIKLIFMLAAWTSWPTTILIAIGTGLAGSVMVKREGLNVITRAKRELASGQFPAEPIADGLIILIGGAFLITPGLITDLIGLSTLVAPIRKLYTTILIRWAKRSFQFRVGTNGGFQAFTSGRARPQHPHQAPFEGEPEDTPHRPTPFKTDDAVDVEFRRVD